MWSPPRPGACAALSWQTACWGKPPWTSRQRRPWGPWPSNESVTDFQPMNVNFGIMPPWPERVKGGKREKNGLIAQRALEALEAKKLHA